MSHRKLEMELQKELDSCYINAERMTNTDDNKKLLYYFLVKYWYVP